MEVTAAPKRERASVWWWLGGLVLGTAVVAIIGAVAVGAVAYSEVAGDRSANEEVEAQLPAVESVIAQVVAPHDPEAQIWSVGSCNGDTPARVAAVVSVPGDAPKVATELVRAAEESGWKRTRDDATSDDRLQRTFDGLAFDFQVRAGEGRVYVESWHRGVERC